MLILSMGITADWNFALCLYKLYKYILCFTENNIAVKYENLAALKFSLLKLAIL